MLAKLKSWISGLLGGARLILVMEVRLWGCLHAWISRRPLQTSEFPYHGNSQLGLIMGGLIVVTPLEIAILEILIPWPWLKLFTLVLAVYGVLWFVMLFASIRTSPHRIAAYGLHLRYGVLAGGLIPFASIDSVDVALRKSPKPGDGLQIDGESAFLAVDGETNLVVRFKEPVLLERIFGAAPPVREVFFRTDEPKRMLEAIKERIMPIPGEASVCNQA